MDIDNTLLVSERNAYYQSVVKMGFEPASFQWSSYADDDMFHQAMDNTVRYSMVTHTPSGYWFKFGSTISFSPGQTRRQESVNVTANGSDRRYFWTWLQYLRRELNTPDLWEAAKSMQNASSAAIADDVDNRPFTLEEKAQLASHLNEIGEYIRKTTQLQGEKLNQLDSRIKYLQESSERLGRKDWLNGFIGVMMSVVMTGIVPAEKAQEVFQFALGLIQPLFHNVLRIAGY